MKLTSKGRYAVMAMLDLAVNSYKSNKAVNLHEISERQNISLSYLEQLFSKIKKNELIDSIRGPGGGYFLAKRLDKISVLDIIRSVDEPIEIHRCEGNGNCLKGTKCLTHNLWTEANRLLEKFFSEQTLDRLVYNYLKERRINATVNEIIKYTYRPEHYGIKTEIFEL